MISICKIGRTAMIAALVSISPLTAQADGLDTVMKSGTLRVAVVLDYPPFGTVGTTMKPEGYDIEVASILAQAIGVKVELVPVSSANKIPYLQSRKADVLLNIGANPERAKVVDFSEPYAPYYIGVFGPANIKVDAVADLSGKTIGATRGSFEELILSKNTPADTDIRRYEDNATTISAFMAGQTQLVAMGNIVAASILASNPTRRPEQKLLLLNSPVRAAVLKDETRLLEKTNAAIAAAKKDGKLPGLALQWLKQPLPEGF
ncbi:MAG: transporter substrate-binding domain-containing protein [Pseudolabrys sp.]|nr:transporter substrate-binding domain-containing protein [Pseudolabrys sp.]